MCKFLFFTFEERKSISFFFFKSKIKSNCKLKKNNPHCWTIAFLSLFQSPAAISLKVDAHFRSLTNMWKVDFLWAWTVSKCTNYLSMKVKVFKNTPGDLYYVKPLLPSLASRYVAPKYEQAPEHVFQTLDFGNKKVNFAPNTSNKPLNGKSCKITVDPVH